MVKLRQTAARHRKITENDTKDLAFASIDYVEETVNPTPKTVDTATYTVEETDKLLHVTYTTTGACTITIPTALITERFNLVIKDAGGATANNITVATEGAETIDGETNQIISGDYDAMVLYSEGTN